jgi:hypothetical protein
MHLSAVPSSALTMLSRLQQNINRTNLFLLMKALVIAEPHIATVLGQLKGGKQFERLFL